MISSDVPGLLVDKPVTKTALQLGSLQGDLKKGGSFGFDSPYKSVHILLLWMVRILSSILVSDVGYMSLVYCLQGSPWHPSFLYQCGLHVDLCTTSHVLMEGKDSTWEQGKTLPPFPDER